MTCSEIEQRIFRRIDDDSSSPATCTSDEVLAAINEGQDLFSLLTLCLEKTETITLSTGVTFFALRPLLTDFLCPLRLTVGGVKITPATLTQLDAINTEWQHTPGIPSRYLTLGFNFAAVTPQPVDDTAAEMTYAYSPARMVDDAFPEIPEAYHPSLVDYGIYRVRLKEGAQGLARGVKYLNRFLDAAQECGDYVRAKSRAAHYDVQPFEMALFDRSRLVDQITQEAKKRWARPSR